MTQKLESHIFELIEIYESMTVEERVYWLEYARSVVGDQHIKTLGGDPVRLIVPKDKRKSGRCARCNQEFPFLYFCGHRMGWLCESCMDLAGDIAEKELKSAYELARDALINGIAHLPSDLASLDLEIVLNPVIPRLELLSKDGMRIWLELDYTVCLVGVIMTYYKNGVGYSSLPPSGN